MSATYPRLNDKLIAFIRAQKMFFVATAPLSPEGSVNLSPKGYDSFEVVDERTVAYLDFGGSGIETHAHLNENGRITIMFCAFEGAANIVRIFGKGRSVPFDHPDFPALRARFASKLSARGVMWIEITRVTDACGWAVPFYDYVGEREQLARYIDNKTEAEWVESRYQRNALSLDGLPGLVRPEPNSDTPKAP